VTVFVDTSALYALLSRDDPSHGPAAEAFRQLAGLPLVTHNYVVVESAALVARRLGAFAVRDLLVDLLAPLEILWVDESIHRAAAAAFLASGSAEPSLVDHTSFQVMRLHGIARAFAIDRDFAAQGFQVVPA